MADFFPFPLAQFFERPPVDTPDRAHAMLASRDGVSGMLSVAQIFGLLQAGDLAGLADPLTRYQAKSDDYTAVAGDNGSFIALSVTGKTLTLPAIGDVVDAQEGWRIVVSAETGTGTIAANGGEFILGGASIVLEQGEVALVFPNADASGWRAAVIPAFGAIVKTDAINSFTKRQQWAKGTDIASTATIALPDDGNYFYVTGTATVAGISTVTPAGTTVKFKATGASVLQHGAAFSLFGGANIQLAAGDVFEMTSLGSGNYEMTDFSRAKVDASDIVPIRAAAYFSGEVSVTILKQFGLVSTITRIGAGVYEITLSSAAPDTNYLVMISGSHQNLGASNELACEDEEFARTTTKFRIRNQNSAGTETDAARCSFTVLW